jgi:hypothetical protein
MRVPLTLIPHCRRWLNQRLPLFVIALLPLLLAATPAAPEATSARVSRIVTATVQIIRLEPISAQVDSKEVRSADRQYRQRDHMPLVEFF